MLEKHKRFCTHVKTDENVYCVFQVVRSFFPTFGEVAINLCWFAVRFRFPGVCLLQNGSDDVWRIWFRCYVFDRVTRIQWTRPVWRSYFNSLLDFCNFHHSTVGKFNGKQLKNWLFFLALNVMANFLRLNFGTIQRTSFRKNFFPKMEKVFGN